VKTLSIKFTAFLSILSVSVINFAPQANAQVFDPETLITLQICNTIMNMQDVNPDNLELRIGRRECNLRAYYVNLCTASGGEYASCWDNNYNDDNIYRQPVQTTTEELEGIIVNNQ
jgi:hypothetical protein